MSSYEDVKKSLPVLIEYPVNLPYVRTGLKYMNKYIIYRYNGYGFIKLYDNDNICHMVYVQRFWEASALRQYLNKGNGEWWSPQYEQTEIYFKEE